MDIQTEQTNAREAAEKWLSEQPDDFPYLELDAKCRTCIYGCKEQWRFAGMTEQDSGLQLLVGPNCPVLWEFNDANPMRKRPAGPMSDSVIRIDFGDYAKVIKQDDGSITLQLKPQCVNSHFAAWIARGHVGSCGETEWDDGKYLIATPKSVRVGK